MPNDVQSYQDQNHWGEHHLKWHIERWWYRFTASQRTAFEAQGYKEAALQEGDKGNGLEFLAMHRVMLRILLTEFPQHTNFFVGWSTPPTDPYDSEDEVPSLINGTKPALPGQYLSAIQRIENQPESFESDDAFGNYIQTSRKLSGVTGAGIHNELHGRWQGITTELNLGNPAVNMKNARFWRLHGWIDRQWTNFRAAKGLDETDPEYVQALTLARQMMQPHGHHLHASAFVADKSPVSMFKMFQTGLTRALLENGADSSEGLSQQRMLDFDFAEVIDGPTDGEKHLVVSGFIPHANMQVQLQPRVYLTIPSYFCIEVIGHLTEAGVPQIAPFVATLKLKGATGSSGVEILGPNNSIKLDILK